MKILAVAAGLWRGGAQEATLEMFKLLKTRDVDLHVLISSEAEQSFRSDIGNLDIPTFSVPGRTVANYPDLAVEDHSELVKSSDLVWITDIEYLATPRIKRIKRDVPVIAHLTVTHSHAPFRLRSTVCVRRALRIALTLCKDSHNANSYPDAIGSFGAKERLQLRYMNF